ncbi:MAG: DNA mismatch repair endonuclease MutL, partial [Nanoarchaeota archaeon]|nr:DNA mismatch repair endonuclease MutL [Nanoarchaeota archaeon]
KINLLTEDLINKIAAGEVIERPASVVKELIENSLDAQATKITIEIEDCGKKLIKISDNGSGMSEEDTKTSILRHATSKISSQEDLFAIQTLGFRGEALASIAAVSQLSIITKQEGEVEGFNLIVESGEIISSGILAAETGTVIEVRNLFFNTPVRKTFMKTDPVELRHIIDVVTRYALINPEIAIKLIHEGHELLNSPQVPDLINNLASLYGVKLAKDLLEVNYQKDGLTVSGYVAQPHQARNDNTQQSVYVNQRWVKSGDVSKAVYEAFHSLLFHGKHPIFVLNLEIAPGMIDVNVHPQKTEVKFSQKDTIFNTVFTAVKETLQKNNLIPELDIKFEEQLSFGQKIKTKILKKAKYKFEPSNQETLEDEEYATPEEDILIPEQWKEELIKEILPPLRILGQVQKTFFVAEAEDGIMIIDQHVVQERILYERFMAQLMNKQVATQSLLRGEMIDLTPTEKILIKENLIELKHFGFQLESFGENTYLLKTIPSVFGKLQPKELLYEIINNFKYGKNKLEQIQEEIITRMACRASIKAGDEVTVGEMQKLLDELANCKLPYTCPHGRSIMIKVSIDELEKKFKRK